MHMFSMRSMCSIVTALKKALLPLAQRYSIENKLKEVEVAFRLLGPVRNI